MSELDACVSPQPSNENRINRGQQLVFKGIRKQVENPRRDDADAILSPTEKGHDECIAKSPVFNNDSMLSPTEKDDPVPATKPVNKKKIFDFNINALGSIKNATNKVLNLVHLDKKGSSSKTVKPQNEEKSKNSENFEPEFILLGEVYSTKTQTKKTEMDLRVQNNSHLNLVDPSLFDIEDETPARSPRNVVEAAKTGFDKENKNERSKQDRQNKNYETVPFASLKLYKAEKANKRTNFPNLLKPKVTRYLGIQGSHLVVGEKVKENFKIKSKTPIERLFKVFIEKDSPKKLTICFFNDKLNPSLPAIKKTYNIENLQNFIFDLKEEISTIDSELKLQYTSQFQVPRS